MPETEDERRARKKREKEERRRQEQEQASAGAAPAEGDEAAAAAAKKKERHERRSKRDAEKSAPDEPPSSGEPRRRKSSTGESEEERRARRAREKEEKESRKRKEAGDDAGGASREKSRHRSSEAREKRDSSHSRDVARSDAPAPTSEDAPPPAASNESAAKAAAVPPKVTVSEVADEIDVANDHEFLERRERRQREKEEKRKARKATQESGGKLDDGGTGTSSYGVNDLKRQGYRAQFERDMERAMALRRLVDLDDAFAMIADIPPQSEYDLYIRNFGKEGMCQTGVQAPFEEDCVDAETQAERVTVRHKGCQAPEELGLYPEREFEMEAHAGGADDAGDGAQGRVEGTDGGVSPVGAAPGGLPQGDAVATSPGKGAAESAPGLGLQDRSGAMAGVDGSGLATFLARVFPVMSGALDENDGCNGWEATQSQSRFEFSTTYKTFSTAGTVNRPVTQVVFSTMNPHHFVAVYGAPSTPGPSALLDQFASVLLLWSIHDVSAPEKMLVNCTAVTSVCFSPTRPYLVYTGTEDGCVGVYDTREPDMVHIAAGSFQQWVLRLPSFVTSWQDESHTTEVVSVCVAGYNAVAGVRKEESEQLVSLDATGVVKFWMLNERDQSKATISNTDHGQHVYSSVRIFPVSTSSCFDGAGGSAPGAQQRLERRTSDSAPPNVWRAATALDFSPADASFFAVACAVGVQRMSRFSSVLAPSIYGPSSAYFRDIVAPASCVTYNVLDSRAILGGYDDGTLRVFASAEAAPQASVALGMNRITHVRCSKTVKWLTFALDDAGSLYIVDFASLASKGAPLCASRAEVQDTGKCLCMDLPAEEKADARLVVLGFQKGILQLHTLRGDLIAPPAQRNESWL